MKPLAFLALLLLPLLGAHSSASDDWSYQWHAVTTPNAQSPIWQVRGDGTHEVNNSGFLITTEGEQSLIYYTTPEHSQGLWDGTVPLVIEFSVEAQAIDGQNEVAAHLSVSNGERCAVVLIKEATAAQYRLEWMHSDARLWVNDVEHPELVRTIAIPPDGPMSNCLYFGDESSTAGGQSLWHYLRWKPLQP